MPSVADLVQDHLLRSLTDPETYAAGRALADGDAVTFDEFGPMKVKANVDDGETFLVDLHVGPGKLAWSCSEPGGSRGDFCRHCVATAIATWHRAPFRASAGEADRAAPAVPPGPPLDASLPAAPPRPLAVPGAGRLFSGVHTILFSPAAEELRAFFQATLGLGSVDAGDGWPIFALPPAELAVHPGDAPTEAFYLICDDLDATLAELEQHGYAEHTPVHEERWGRVTELLLPGGTTLPLYEPKHPRPTA